MIPFLRDSTSLETAVRTDAEHVIEAYLRVGALYSSSELGASTSGAFSRGLAESFIGARKESSPLEGLSKSGAIHDSEIT